MIMDLEPELLPFKRLTSKPISHSESSNPSNEWPAWVARALIVLLGL